MNFASIYCLSFPFLTIVRWLWSLGSSFLNGPANVVAHGNAIQYNQSLDMCFFPDKDSIPVLPVVCCPTGWRSPPPIPEFLLFSRLRAGPIAELQVEVLIDGLVNDD